MEFHRVNRSSVGSHLRVEVKHRCAAPKRYTWEIFSEGKMLPRATELSATDAWAEPLPVIEVNVWTSLYVPWARNPAFLTTEAVTGSDMGDETHHHDRLRSPRCLDRTVVKSI